MDSTIPRRSRRKDDLRSERSHPNANSPIGHASESDANRVHSYHAPALRRAQRPARLGSACAEAGDARADTAAKATPLATATIPPRISASIRNPIRTIKARQVTEPKSVHCGEPPCLGAGDQPGAGTIGQVRPYAQNHSSAITTRLRILDKKSIWTKPHTHQARAHARAAFARTCGIHR
jgi:hypothetical protein